MLGPIGLEEERSVAVAIDRNDKHSFYALQWTTDVLLSKGQTLILIHVHQSSLPKPIPTGNGDFSNGAQDPDDSSTDVFLPYRLFCSSRQVFCDTVMLEDQDIGKALIDYVSLYRIQILVLGTQSKAKHLGIPRILLNNRSEVASTVMKGAPGYCSVYTIAKGNKVASAREATHPLKSSLERIFQNVPERKLNTSASMCRSRTPSDEVVFQARLYTDISLSADSSLLALYQNLPSDQRNNAASSSESASFSSYARRKNNGNNFTRGGLVYSGEQKSSAVDDDDECSRPNSLPSSPTTDDVAGEMMRRIELETNQTMEMYHEACKQAVQQKQKTKELENLCKEMEKKLREVELEKMEALAMFEKTKEVLNVNQEMEKKMKEAEREREEAVAMAAKEKAMRMAATEEMKAAKKAAERETKKRKDVERNITAMREAEASKIIVLSNLAESHNVSNKSQHLHKILIAFIVFYFYFFELKRALKYE
ncbi:PREDICTED: U-box domain-containing protein 35-like [Ipomoea nil]|uniref:U-box domain-containing protein 35-like n=1 Tax=Ipomoea nil TaxID=35883 RepID=UPI0009009891|nr:PREDICTED: U-box domain-containing protein 35-like [Ipomoea nil]